ncbi:hypothetical protein [Cohnella soli]|uniref:Spore coat protein n=1 Tax=Cohnella soli TaxID=425005 RepID=A0ABW0I053_9BACL
MFKWISWVIKIGATALLLSFLSIWTTGYIVNSYMETVVKQLNLPVDIKPIALSGVWGKLWGASDSPSKSAEVDKGDTSSKTDGEPSSSPVSSPSAEPSNSVGGVSESPSDKPSSEPSTPADASADPEASTDPGKNGAVPVMGDGEQQTSSGISLTDEQRQSLYALVVSKLNPAQLQQLSDALKGGQTPEQMKGVQEMLKSALTHEEFVQMMSILQGTSSEDSGENAGAEQR